MRPIPSYAELESEDEWDDSSTLEWLGKGVACGGHPRNSGAVLYNPFRFHSVCFKVIFRLPF